MQSRELSLALVWLLVIIGSFWSYSDHGVKGDQNVDQFLNDKESQVTQIAKLATENDGDCDLLATCQSNCSRAGCSALLSDDLLCTYVSENQNCMNSSSSSNATCNDIRANFLRSYVRTPTQFASDAVPSEVIDAVCVQRNLDPLFRQLQTVQNASQYYFNFYFGSVDGSFRFYPGVEVKSCYTFDPRKRPWYNGAISVEKDLVILLDSGFSMGDNLGLFTFQTTRFATAQNITEQLLSTLTPDDRVTVITFNSSVEATLVTDSFSVPDAGLNTTDPLFQQLVSSVSSSAPSNNNNDLGSNFTTGLTQATTTFSTNPRTGVMKIVLVFTDGESSPNLTELASVISDLQTQGIKLLIYELGVITNPLLGQLACQTAGLAEQLNALDLLQNPLYAINSYFSFLARTQLNTTDGTKAFWQRVYTDYGSLGPVITVALPAMSADGSRLLGVAGIDVQVGGLSLDFRTSLDSTLISSRRTTISTSSQGASFGQCNVTTPEPSFGTCNTSYNFSPFCAQDDFSSSYTELVCCADCSGSLIQSDKSSRSGPSPSIIIVVIVCVLAGCVMVGLSFCLWFKFRSSWGQPMDPFVKIPRFSYKTLSLATDKFSERKLLGRGTFGTVFAGTLKDGTHVAVKKLFDQPNYSDFEAEIRVLATANHNNLVALKGFCTEQNQILVYEFLENGDLDQWLFVLPETEKRVLQWKDRVGIAKGVAKGLAYLHEELQNHQRVTHSDIKPANILLDANFGAKVADFGMAKLYKTGSESFATGGTMGYVAPEIFAGAPTTTKSDVYSYGIVLLEMVSGRKFSDPLVNKNLPMWVGERIDENCEWEVIDPRLGTLEEADKQMAKRLIQIALLCTSKASELRPDMGAVAQMIEGFLPVRSLPPSFGSITDTVSELSCNTFSTETSSLGLSRSKKEPVQQQESKSFSFGKSLTSSVFDILKLRPGKTTSLERPA